MKGRSLRPLILVYAVVAGLISLACTILQLPPSLFFIDLFAPEEGDTYPVSVVFLLTALLLLSPLFAYMAIAKARRTSAKTIVKAEMTGIFVRRQKAFVAAMAPIPIFVNGVEIGMVDNGRTGFFQAGPGQIIVQAGTGRQASEALTFNLREREKLLLEVELRSEIFTTRVLLRLAPSTQPKG